MNDFSKDLLLLLLKNIKQSNLKVARLLALELIAKKKKKKKKELKKNQEEENLTANNFVYYY